MLTVLKHSASIENLRLRPTGQGTTVNAKLVSYSQTSRGRGHGTGHGNTQGSTRVGREVGAGGETVARDFFVVSVGRKEQGRVI